MTEIVCCYPSKDHVLVRGHTLLSSWGPQTVFEAKQQIKLLQTFIRLLVSELRGRRVGIIFIQPIFIQPIFIQPIFKRPIFIQPIFKRPIFIQPIFKQPFFIQPIFKQPIFIQPIFIQPIFKQPIFIQPIFKQPIFIQPIFKQPIFIQPIFKQPIFIQPIFMFDASGLCLPWQIVTLPTDVNGVGKEGNILFNDTLNTFYLRLYGVRYMVKYHSAREEIRCHHMGYSPISSKVFFICIILQTG